MNAADRRRLTPALGVVAVVLALLLIALWSGFGRGAHWHDQAGPERLPPAGATLPPPVVPPLAQFAEVWQRPLFSPTRTPEPTGDGAASSNLQLTGVIMLSGLKMAILHDRTTGKDYRVVEGRPSLDGPALVELHPRSAVVEVSGSRLQLQLIPGPSPFAGTQPATGGQAQPVPGSSSAMFSRREGEDSEPARLSGPGQESPEARARALKARIEAARRRVQQQGGGQ